MDAAFKTAAYPSYTTDELRGFIAAVAHGPATERMVAEIARREAVAAGDMSRATPGERLRAIREAQAAEPAKVEASAPAPTALDLAEQVAATAIDFIKAVCDDAPDWSQTGHKLNDQIHAFRTAARAEAKAARQ